MKTSYAHAINEVCGRGIGVPKEEALEKYILVIADSK